MSESHHVTTVQGLTVESVEWLPSGGDAGLVRVRGRWADPEARIPELPALCVRLGADAQRFDSLPDARFGRDPTVWRGTYLVPAALMEVASGSLSLSWPGGREAALPAPEAGFEPPSTLPLRPEVREPQGGEVIDRAVLAERRARRAEAAERAQARRAEEALKAVEVLELRSTELERRLEALRAAPDAEPPGDSAAEPAQGDGAPVTSGSAPPLLVAAESAGPGEEQPPAGDESVRAALAAALASLTKLRRAAHDQRLRLRTVELQRAADAVALATLRGDPGTIAHLREALRRRQAELEEAMERARAAEADVAESRRQAAEQVAAAQRRAAADAAAVRERAHDETAAARAQTAEARRGLAAASEALERERSAHGETTERLVAREAELSAIAAELAAVRAELDDVRDGAAGRAHELEQRLAVLEEELAAERAGRLDASAELAAARTRLAAAEAGLRAETVARAALEQELDRERTAREALSAALDRAEAALAGRSEAPRAEAGGGAAGDLAGRLAALEATLATERDARAAAEAAFEATLATERDARAAAEATLAAAGDAATAEAGALQARITELERTASAADLARHAAEQAAAAAAASPPEREPDRVSADLDAAAAALRARASSPFGGDDDPAEAAMVSPGGDDRLLTEAATVPPGAVDPPPFATAVDGHGRVGVAVAATPRNLDSPAAPAAPPADRWLRRAMARMARDDPASAARLLLALAPALRAVVEPPLDFDLTIRGTGTYAVTLAPSTATVRRIGSPRPRRQAAYHVAAEVAALAELVAGADTRLSRWHGPVRVRGHRRAADAVAAALRRTDVSLAAAVRAGAVLPPDLVFRAFAYVIEPEWTRGHRFTVAQQVTGATPTTLHVLVRDGARVTVQRTAPPGGGDATVTMSPAAFASLLRGEAPAGGDRPVIRGDRAAVAVLKGWTDRAQGLLA